MSKLKELLARDNIRVFMRYALVGCFTLAVDYGMYALLFYLFRVEMNAANTAATVAAAVFAYVGNKRFAFRTHAPNRRALFREAASFFASRAATMAFQVFALFAVHNVCGLDERLSIASKAVISAIVIAVNYFTAKGIVFGRGLRRRL